MSVGSSWSSLDSSLYIILSGSFSPGITEVYSPSQATAAENQHGKWRISSYRSRENCLEMLLWSFLPTTSIVLVKTSRRKHAQSDPWDQKIFWTQFGGQSEGTYTVLEEQRESFPHKKGQKAPHWNLSCLSLHALFKLQ